MTTSQISDKHGENADTISAQISIAVLAISGLLSLWVVLRQLMSN